MVFLNYSEEEYYVDSVEDTSYFTGRDREIWLYRLNYGETAPPVVTLSLVNPVEINDTQATLVADKDITLYRRMVIFNAPYQLYLVIVEDINLQANNPTLVDVFPAEVEIANIDQVNFPVYPLKPLLSLETGNITKISEEDVGTNNKGQGPFNAKSKIVADAELNITGTVNRADPCLSLLEFAANNISRLYVELRNPAYDNYGEGFGAQIFQSYLINYDFATDRNNIETLNFTLRATSDGIDYKVLGSDDSLTGLAYPLDISLLSDNDLDNGIYIATSDNIGYLYQSEDGLNYTLLDYLPEKDVIGKVLQPLPVTNPYYLSKQKILIHFDKATELTAPNYALIGNEIIYYETVRNKGLQVFEISNLYRGLNGTESAIFTHNSSELFILLSDLTRYPVAPSLIGTTIYYKLSIGDRPLDTVEALSTTYQAKSLQPFAPHFYPLTKYSNGDLLIQWTRRPRKNNQLQDNQDLPLIESPELYKLTIGDREILTSASTYLYTANQQTLDFGGTISQCTASISQQGSIGYGATNISTLQIGKLVL